MSNKEIVHKIDDKGNSVWMPLKEWELRQKWYEDLFWGRNLKHIPREDDEVKLAWVVINGERKMIGVDRTNMRGYELREDIPTWKLPLVPLEYDKFERWCTTFDV